MYRLTWFYNHGVFIDCLVDVYVCIYISTPFDDCKLCYYDVNDYNNL